MRGTAQALQVRGEAVRGDQLPLRSAFASCKSAAVSWRRAGVTEWPDGTISNTGSFHALSFWRRSAERRCSAVERAVGRFTVTQTSPRNYPGSCSQREPKSPKGDDVRSANLLGVVWGGLAPVSI